MIAFDWTVNFGHLLSIMTVLGGGFVVLLSMRWQIQEIDKRTMKIEERIEQITIMLVTIARQDERLNHLEDRVTEVMKRALRNH